MISSSRQTLLIVGVFLLTIGLSLAAVVTYGVSVPFFDEWDAEASWLYSLYSSGNLSLSHFLSPHNGHRIVVTRAVSLSLFILNNGWNPMLQMYVNATLHGLTALILFRHAVPLVRGKLLVPLTAFTILIFSVPYASMSLIVAFQTQFYFMLFFSVLCFSKYSTNQYFLCFIFGVLASISMSPGAFSFLAIASALIINILRDKEVSAKDAALVASSIVYFSVFIFLLPEEPAAKIHYASSFKSFMISLTASISWPYRIGLGIGLVINLPLLFFAYRSFREEASPFLASILFFLIFQVLAMSYFRGGDGVPPANRYWEIMLLGVWANGFCLFIYLGTSINRYFKYCALAWFAVAVVGMASLAQTALTTGFPERLEQSNVAKELIRDYLVNGDATIFRNRTSFETSHQDTATLIELLDDPEVIKILPKSLTQSAPERNLGLPIPIILTSIGLALIGVGIARRDKA